MVELCQATGIVEADARTPVYDGLRLIIQLVIAFEDVLQLFLGYALACICHADLYLLVCGVELHVDMSATRGEFQGVRQEV